jgi:hypothetical protein
VVNGAFSSRSSSPDALAARRLRRCLEFRDPADHGSARQAAGLSHRTDSALAYRLGISGCHQTPRALVQNASKYLELAHQGCGVRHRCQYKTFGLKMFY